MDFNVMFLKAITPVFTPISGGRWLARVDEPDDTPCAYATDPVDDIVSPIEPERVYEQPQGLKVIPQYKPLMDATHLLIAGTTGAGKSVCLNGLIYSMLGLSAPDRVRFVLIDPKRVELSGYKNLPHTISYTYDCYEALGLLKDAVDTIEDRYAILGELSSKQWQGYKLCIIIDELADLLIGPCGKDIKFTLQKILQIGRAAGVSVIACTQAPNRSIIPANLTLNFTDRVALRCVSSIESRQIIQVSGAEKLPQYGKGLYLSPKGLVPLDIPFLSESEINGRINYWLDI